MTNPSRFMNLCAFALASLTLTACGPGEPEVTKEPEARPVKLITLSEAVAQTDSRYPARISAGRRADLSFLVGGVIEEMQVADADLVREGDVIARLSAADFESNVSSARASFDNAEEEYQRALRLAEQNAIAQNQLAQRKTQRDVARAQLDTAEKALEDSVLRAPFDGVVASTPGSAQQTVSPGTSIATVINVDVLEATIALPASVIAQVPMREDRGAFVELDVAPGRLIEATFDEADLVADATSQTYEVQFRFTPPEGMVVLPGMSATMTLSSADLVSGGMSLAVPLAAILSDGDGQYVWVFDEESMTVSRRNISVEPGIGETVIVNAGLSDGDQIVGAGGSYLSEGMAVVPWAGQE